jgi:putative FmdB family regulatory protein
MPTYDYHCPDCGDFEARRSMAERDQPLSCPVCSAPAGRVLVSAPALADMAGEVRLAMATNERARHEPKLSSNHRHHAGCGCGTKKPAASSGPRSFANKRPWMISH